MPASSSIVYAATRGWIDDVPVDKIRQYERELHAHMEANGKDVLDLIKTGGKLSDEVIKRLDEELSDFAKIFGTGKAGQKKGAKAAAKPAAKKAEAKKPEPKKAAPKKPAKVEEEE